MKLTGVSFPFERIVMPHSDDLKEFKRSSPLLNQDPLPTKSFFSSDLLYFAVDCLINAASYSYQQKRAFQGQ
jgi:hypothetical protein